MRRTIGLALLIAGWPLASTAVAAQPPLPPQRPSLIEVPLPPEPAGLFGLPGAMPSGRSLYLPLVVEAARENRLPSEIADAVMRVESGYDPGVVGGVGERGLMQVRPGTAAMLGFRGSLADLSDPGTNIRLGVAYLAGAWRLSGGDLCRTLMKYRAGHGSERMSALSVEYCRRARAHLAELGSPLAAGILPPVDFGPPGMPPGEIPGPTALGLAASNSAVPASANPGKPRIVRVGGRLVVVRRPMLRGTGFWAAHTARIKAIEARLRWRRGGIMAPS